MFCGFFGFICFADRFTDWENFEYIDILVRFLSFLYPSVNAGLVKASLIFVCHHYFVFLMSIVKPQTYYVITAEIIDIVYV